MLDAALISGNSSSALQGLPKRSGHVTDTVAGMCLWSGWGLLKTAFIPNPSGMSCLSWCSVCFINLIFFFIPCWCNSMKFTELFLFIVLLTKLVSNIERKQVLSSGVFLKLRPHYLLFVTVYLTTFFGCQDYTVCECILSSFSIMG